jgi:hypothetical protein
VRFETLFKGPGPGFGRRISESVSKHRPNRIKIIFRDAVPNSVGGSKLSKCQNTYRCEQGTVHHVSIGNRCTCKLSDGTLTNDPRRIK